VAGFAVVADAQAVVAEQPGYGAFDDPPVLAESGAGLDAFAGDAHRDASVTDPFPELGVVVGPVGVELGRLAAAGAAAGLDSEDGRPTPTRRWGTLP
jgi:hypothetical protein